MFDAIIYAILAAAAIFKDTTLYHAASSFSSRFLKRLTLSDRCASRLLATIIFASPRRTGSRWHFASGDALPIDYHSMALRRHDI